VENWACFRVPHRGKTNLGILERLDVLPRDGATSSVLFVQVSELDPPDGRVYAVQP
jgi:hypothetical protein